MNKVKLSWGKLSIIAVLSLGFMVLGIGSISWAMFSMWAQSDYYADVTLSRYSISDPMESGHLSANLYPDHTFQPEYSAERSNNVEIDPSLILPAPDKTLYHNYPAEGDSIGSLTIPALNRKLPIFEGTGEKELEKGVGHFIQSVLPGEEDNCVLSGHRETVFRKLYNLKIGDQLIVETSAGTFTYEAIGTRIVHKDDKTVIVPTDHAVLTLTTCYPFYYLGHAPDRYIVSASLVKIDKSFD